MLDLVLWNFLSFPGNHRYKVIPLNHSFLPECSLKLLFFHLLSRCRDCLPFHQASLSAVSVTAKRQEKWRQLTVKPTIMTHSHSREPRGTFREQDSCLDWINRMFIWFAEIWNTFSIMLSTSRLVSIFIFRSLDMMLYCYINAKK